MAPRVIGFDTESYKGHPITMQFYSEDVPGVSGIWDVTENNITLRALRHLTKYCKQGVFLVFAHNLDYDMVALFYPRWEQLIENRDKTVDFSYDQYEISGIYSGGSGPNFFKMEHKRTDLVFIFADSMSWFGGPASQAAEIVCPHLPKLERPEGLGSIKYTSKDDYFAEYSMRDAEIAYFEGKVINQWHQDYNIDQTYSAAGMAGKLFQRHYVSDPLWLPPTLQEKYAAMEAYHGGKNLILPDAAERWHHGVDSWDVSSAYPHAMSLMPAFSKRSLYRDYALFPNNTRRFPEHGVYCVSGTAPDCQWPVFIEHSDQLNKLVGVRGEFESLWVTGYELNEARRAGEIKISNVWGHYYDSEDDPVTDTALGKYIAHFYDLKQTAEDPISRSLYKLLLNSIYGKFWEMNDGYDGEGKKYRRAGNLWHPLMAALVTAHTRSVMHRLEHDTQAIHTSTDGVLCASTDSPASFPWAPQEGLGSIESEDRDLVVAMFRNKLYLALSKEKGTPSEYFDGMYLAKGIRHAFPASPQELERCAATGDRSYTRQRRVSLRSKRDGERVNDFVTETRHIRNVGPLKGRPPKRKQ